jgi:hypothetical protein
MELMNGLCTRINAPTKPEKEEGPSISLTFLGILLDSVNMRASITQERKLDILSAIQSLQGRRTVTKRELLSIIGKLAFATKVVPPGRIFLRRLIDLSTTVTPLHHHITLNADARADLTWWLHSLPSWPGTSLFLQSHWSPAPDMELYTDASDMGYGAYWNGQWFNNHWTLSQVTMTIAWRETHAILVACSTSDGLIQGSRRLAAYGHKTQ